MNEKSPNVHTVTWNGDSVYVARNTKGIETKMEEILPEGLKNTFMTPVDLFISTLGCCPGILIVNTCKEKGMNITGMFSRVESVRSEEPPTVFTSAHVHFILTGEINEKEIDSIIDDVMTRRCPIAVSFGRLTDLTWSNEIIRNS